MASDTNSEVVDAIDGMEHMETNSYEGPLIRGSRHRFELEETDGISLSSKLLVDLISDSPAVLGESRRCKTPAPALSRPHKRQKIDISQIEY